MLDLEKLNYSKIFVKKCKSELEKLKFSNEYDYDRFIREETGELVTNYKLGNSDRRLFIDDVCDSIWTLTAVLHEKDISLIFDFFEILDTITEKEDDLIVLLSDFVKIKKYDLALLTVFKLAKINNVDFLKHYDLLIKENMSKLDYPRERVGEVFRDGKCNKKDSNGNLYPWYTPQM